MEERIERCKQLEEIVKVTKNKESNLEWEEIKTNGQKNIWKDSKSLDNI